MVAQVIIRSARPHQNFTVIHNELIEQKTLSWRARGLLVYLLSKPDHWRTTTANLAAQGPDGMHTVRVTMLELQEAGYIRRIRKQNSRGQWSTYTVIFDRPQPVDKPVQNCQSYPPPDFDLPRSVGHIA